MSLDAYFTGKDCGFPGRPGNGSTIGAEKFFYPGEEVTFQCDNGYILFGADRRICQEDGSWSGALPECSKILTITRAHNNTVDTDNINCTTVFENRPKKSHSTLRAKRVTFIF